MNYLKNPNHHFNKYPDHPWLRTRKEIEKWIVQNINNAWKSDFRINKDLTVSSVKYRTFNLSKEVKIIPIQFKSVGGLKVNDGNLESLIGTPQNCFELSIIDCKVKELTGLGEAVTHVILEKNLIESFCGMPENNNISYLALYGNPIKSWNGFSKCKNVDLWFTNKDKENVEKIIKFIVDSPDNIQNMCFNNNWFHIDGRLEILVCDDKYVIIDEIKRMKAIKDSKDSIENELVENKTIKKRRKL